MIKPGGFDLSLTGTGAVAVPATWDREWRRVERASFGVKLAKGASVREVTRRIDDLALDLCRWILRVGVTHVYVEDLPTHAAFNIVPLAELRGHFRVVLLRETGLDVEFVNQSNARKILLGKLPQKDRKAHVVEALKAAGADFDDSDQFDAFAAVNARLEQHGIPHFQELLFPFDAPKPKRARKAVAA